MVDEEELADWDTAIFLYFSARLVTAGSDSAGEAGVTGDEATGEESMEIIEEVGTEDSWTVVMAKRELQVVWI